MPPDPGPGIVSLAACPPPDTSPASFRHPGTPPGRTTASVPRGHTSGPSSPVAPGADTERKGLAPSFHPRPGRHRPGGRRSGPGRHRAARGLFIPTPSQPRQREAFLPDSTRRPRARSRPASAAASPKASGPRRSAGSPPGGRRTPPQRRPAVPVRAPHRPGLPRHRPSRGDLGVLQGAPETVRHRVARGGPNQVRGEKAKRQEKNSLTAAEQLIPSRRGFPSSTTDRSPGPGRPLRTVGRGRLLRPRTVARLRESPTLLGIRTLPRYCCP
jgi:hypothetical protein